MPGGFGALIGIKWLKQTKSRQEIEKSSEGLVINFLKQVIINLEGKARLWFRESTLDVPAFVLQYLLIANANYRYLSNFWPSLLPMTLCAFSSFHEKFWMLQKVRRPRSALFPTHRSAASGTRARASSGLERRAQEDGAQSGEGCRGKPERAHRPA